MEETGRQAEEGQNAASSGNGLEEKKPQADQVTDKFSDNAGDNAVTRYEINASITSPAVANEHSFREAMNRELQK